MRIIPFPSEHDGEGLRTVPCADDRDAVAAWLCELEGALYGHATGPAAESWRGLQADVRALAPTIDPDFERALGERLAARAAGAPAHRRKLSSGRARVGRSWRRPALALLISLALVVPVAIIAGEQLASPPRHPVTATAADNLGTAQRGEASAGGASHPGTAGAEHASRGVVKVHAPEATPSTAAGIASPPPSDLTAPAPTQGGGRLQQLAASVTLTSTPSNVQSLADRVSALVVSDGGFVARSQVQQQSSGGGEAQLTVELPSSRLSSALAALGRLAPVQSQSQSLQDITSSYNAARGRLNDAKAEREALLRALARAQTQAQVESLHARLAQARAEISRAAGDLKAVSHRAADAQVEVTVLGSQRSVSGGLTADRALHDAGRVLLVTLLVLAIAAAVLVPVALVLLGLALARHAWLRRQRERALAHS